MSPRTRFWVRVSALTLATAAYCVVFDFNPQEILWFVSGYVLAIGLDAWDRTKESTP